MLKQATVKQFINKNHIDLDVVAEEDKPVDFACMIDIIQTVTQIIKQKVEISSSSQS